MYILCLFVVLAALFITVLNSHTAHTVSVGEKAFDQLSPTAGSSKTISISDTENKILPTKKELETAA